MKYDIDIDGQLGFYTITGNTLRGKQWMFHNVYGCTSYDSTVPCDDTRMSQETADGAVEEGLRVRVNGRKYLGNNRVAA